MSLIVGLSRIIIIWRLSAAIAPRLDGSFRDKRLDIRVKPIPVARRREL